MCKYCFNARIIEPAKTEEEAWDRQFETELTDDNDFSSCGIGAGDEIHNMFIDAGGGKPVSISVMKWDDKYKQNFTVCKYVPKYCPECGRFLGNDYKE